EKRGVVTGGADGSGRGIAEVFAEEGASVLVADIDDAAGEAVAAGIRAGGGRATFRHTDVSDESQVEAAVAEAAEAGAGRVDVLCNNASYLGAWHGVASAARGEWGRALQTGLMGRAHGTRRGRARLGRRPHAAAGH